MKENVDKNLHKIYVSTVLSNEDRLKLFKLIVEKGPLTFSEIKNAIGMTDGKLFYHLKKLDLFITKDGAGRYIASDKGIQVANKAGIEKTLQPRMEFKPFMKKFIYTTGMEDVFSYLMHEPRRTLFELLLTILIAGYISGNTRYIVVMGGLYRMKTTLGVMFSMSIVLLSVFLSAIILKFILDLFFEITFKKYSFTTLLIVVMFSYIPQYIFLLIVGILDGMHVSIEPFDFVLQFGLSLVVVLWSFIILTAALSVILEQDIEKSMLVTWMNGLFTTLIYYLAVLMFTIFNI